MKINNKISVVLAVSAFVLAIAGPSVVFAATSPTLTATVGYSVLGASTVTCTGATTVTGDVGVAAGTAITGFPTPCTVSPGVLQSNTASAIAAQAENLSAFGALDAGANANANCIGGIYPDGQDLTLLSPLGPGVYCSAGSFRLTGNLNLTGSGVWIFKTASTLITSPGSSVTGGDACNIWWRVGSSATIDTTTAFKGNILALTDIGLNTGATLSGRAMVQTGQVTLDANTISGPLCAVAPTPTPGSSSSSFTNNTITVVKHIINDNGGTSTSFPLFVNGTSVLNGESIKYAPGTYTVSETTNPKYTATFSGDCNAAGQVNHGGINTQNDTCIITNDDIGAPVAVPPVPPLIDVVKVPSPLALPAGPGQVMYTYTLRNVGTVPVTNVTMVGDTCSPITLISGDNNSDSKLDLNETWTYRCGTTLSATHTNTVVATGWANGISATDIASATVVVGSPIVPPLIHITKIPSPLTLPVGGGMVTYTNRVTNPGTVALSNVIVTDNKCSPVGYVSGDTNGDSKLDPTEAWTYTCRTNLTQNTTNTVVASGQANGMTVRDFAIATVLVAVPKLPNTGLSPAGNTPWSIAIVAGVIMFIATSLFVVLKRRSI